jgi:shikimate dehydrogenase
MEQKIALFGVVGKKLSHSFSPTYFATKFKQENIHNCRYQAYEVDSPEAIIELFKQHPALKGVNVTIPYKESIIYLLDELDTEAKTIGAVNTIKREANGKLKGYNTDIYGFSMSIKPFFASHHDRALIFGSGGASKAINYVLQNLGVSTMFVVRDRGLVSNLPNVVQYDELGAEGIANFKLLVNATPIGMYPNVDVQLPIPYEGITADHLLYDVIYNPTHTSFLKQGEKFGAKTINGLNMLKLQAEKSWEIWNN